MKKLLYIIDEKVNIITIMFFFWAVFWFLNGGDKFLNGEFIAVQGDWATKGVIMDAQGDVINTFNPMQTVGWYGVNRDAQIVNYFSRLGLPSALALMSLYGIAVTEIVLGVLYSILLIWSVAPQSMKVRMPELLADRTLHRIAFKGSVLVFAMFSIGDILFGDRTELWEHGTFIVLTIITYDMWYKSDRFLLQLQKEEGVSTERSPQATTYGQD